MKTMTFHELCEAVVIPDSGLMIAEDMNDLRLLHPEQLLRTCSSLITYNVTTAHVSLAHSSVWQFLTSPGIRNSEVRRFSLNDENFAGEIGIFCLKYLCLPVFRSGYCRTEQELAQRLKDWPLLSYAAETLFEYLRYIKLDHHTRSLLLTFLSSYIKDRGGNFGAWVQAFRPATISTIEAATPLYYAARFGLLHVVRLILQVEGTKSLEKPAGVYLSTPLHVAAFQGEAEVVRELLKVGANAREVNANGETGLAWAEAQGYTEIARMLIDAGASLGLQSLHARVF